MKTRMLKTKDDTMVRMTTNKTRHSVMIALFSFLFFVSGFSLSYAANLYLEPQSGTYSQGDTFTVKVRLDNQDECVNAVDVYVKYPKDSIQAVDVGRGDSILTLWTVEPTIDRDKGVVHFSGGLPGGYCGRIEGDPEYTNVLAEIVFQVPGLIIGEKGADNGLITFDPQSEVLLNDGFGTKAALITSDSAFAIVSPGASGTKDTWFDHIREDTTPPEAFSVSLSRNEFIENGKWFITFNTVDKQSGIDHFEVYETDRENDGFIYHSNNTVSEWVEARSPYILKDQTLNSIIRVRAFDKAGNQRLAATIPDESLRVTTAEPISPTIFYVSSGIALLIILALIVFLIWRRAKKKTRATMIENGNEQADPNEGNAEPPLSQ